ncbi:MAG: hypothetical protein VKL20_02440 [Synechocystis sp.]|nr:hypothetical protein [Synechocystis sp.]
MQYRLKPIKGCEWDYDIKLAKQQIQDELRIPLKEYKKQHPELKKIVDLRTKLGIWRLYKWVFNALPSPIRKTYPEKAHLIVKWTGIKSLSEVRKKYPQFFGDLRDLRKTATLANFIENVKKSKFLFPGMLPEEVFENAKLNNFDIDKILKEYKKLGFIYHPDYGESNGQFQILAKIKDLAIQEDQIRKASPTYREVYQNNFRG